MTATLLRSRNKRPESIKRMCLEVATMMARAEMVRPLTHTQGMVCCALPHRTMPYQVRASGCHRNLK